MDSSLVMILTNKNCPLELYGCIWNMIPHNDKPDMSQLKDDILNFQEMKSKKLITSIQMTEEAHKRLIGHSKTYHEAVCIVKRMMSDHDYLMEIKSRGILKMGPYVKLRKILNQ